MRSPTLRVPARLVALCAVVFLASACHARGDAAERTRAAAASASPAAARGGDALGAQPDTEPAPVPGLAAERFPRPERPVASIVAPQWSDEDSRDNVGEALDVMDRLRVGAGQRVADIGAGAGYYVVKLADRVGPRGVVYAQDIMPDYLASLRQRVREEGLKNVRVITALPHDPRLPAGRVELALMVHMYHEITAPYALLWNLVPAMSPGARVAVLDLERPTAFHGTPIALLTCEFAAVGYARDTVYQRSPSEYVAVFRAPTLAARPSPEALAATLTRSPCRP